MTIHQTIERERYIDHRIIVEAAECDGGLQIAPVMVGETPDQVSRDYGAVILDYGPYGRIAAKAACKRLRLALSD